MSRLDIINDAIDPGLTDLQYGQAEPPPLRAEQIGATGIVLSVSQGGTGANSQPAARSSLGAAASGINTDITQLNGASQVDVSSVYKKSGVQVVGGRKTGWGSPAGTLSRSSYSGTTAAALPIGAAYTQAEVVALRDAVVLLSQAVAALLTDLHGSTGGHGLVGT